MALSISSSPLSARGSMWSVSIFVPQNRWQMQQRSRLPSQARRPVGLLRLAFGQPDVKSFCSAFAGGSFCWGASALLPWNMRLQNVSLTGATLDHRAIAQQTGGHAADFQPLLSRVRPPALG